MEDLENLENLNQNKFFQFIIEYSNIYNDFLINNYRHFDKIQKIIIIVRT